MKTKETQKANLIFFDDLNKIVKLIPLNYFKDKMKLEPVGADSILNSDVGKRFYQQGRDYELGIGCEQNYGKAFDAYLSGALAFDADCCLKVSFYYLYGYGIQFSSRTLFELYLTEAVRLGSKEAANYKRIWSKSDIDGYFETGIVYPVQCVE